MYYRQFWSSVRSGHRGDGYHNVFLQREAQNRRQARSEAPHKLQGEA